MTNAGVSIATLAPPPPPPRALDGPALPAPPAGLRQGAAGLGPLPPPPGKVGRTAERYLLGGVIPVAAALLLTLVGALVRWPVPGTAVRAQVPPPLPAPGPTVPKPKPKPKVEQPVPGPQSPETKQVTTPTPGPGGGNVPSEPTIPEATLDAARSGRPVPYQLPGVTAPVPRSLWPGVNPGPRYAEHIADVTVTFVVLADGRIDPASIEVSGPGAAPLKDATVAAYAPLQFQPGRVGSQVVPVLMTHRYRYPPN
jgi:hypothetical protein